MGHGFPIAITAKPIEGMDSAKKRLIGGRINSPGGRQAGSLLRGQGNFDLRSDGLGHIAEQSQDILEIPIVVLGPEVLVGLAVDQLGGDPHLSIRPQDRTLDQRIHIQLLRNLWQGLVGVCIAHGRGTRDDPQGPDLRQIGDQCLVHPLDKVLLLRIVHQVVEGQHGQGPDLWPGLAGRAIDPTSDQHIGDDRERPSRRHTAPITSLAVGSRFLGLLSARPRRLAPRESIGSASSLARSSSSLRTSLADWYRRSGSFSRQCRITRPR